MPTLDWLNKALLPFFAGRVKGIYIVQQSRLIRMHYDLHKHKPGLQFACLLPAAF